MVRLLSTKMVKLISFPIKASQLNRRSGSCYFLCPFHANCRLILPSCIFKARGQFYWLLSSAVCGALPMATQPSRCVLLPAFAYGGSTVCWCRECKRVKKKIIIKTSMQLCCVHTHTFSRTPLYSATPVFERWRQMRKRRSIKAFVFAIIKEKGFCLFLLNLSRVITDNAHIRIAIDSSSAFIMRKGEVFIF